MNAILLSIGDELVSGLTLNTNSAWLAEQLAGLGIHTAAHVTVGDHLESIAAAIRQACEQLELEPSLGHPGGVLLITGGLGPTEDDLTRQALADALQQQLVEDPDAMVQIERFFKSIHRPMSPSNRLQALRPHEALIIENRAGTAPGLWAKTHHTQIFVMPGVPREMKEMFTRSVLPAIAEVLEECNAEPVITQVTKINTFGMGESQLGEKIKDLMARPQSAAPPFSCVGTTVHEGIVSVRIYATGTREIAEAETARLKAVIHSRLGALIFSEAEEPLEAAVGKLLVQSGQTVATAESCTGGLLATLLTNMPGSSGFFLRGWVTYANAAKQEELGVPAETIEAHGAVSEPTARAMATGAKAAAKTDFALATTGIAGPDGGSVEKPVGTVWIALASPDGVDAWKYIFPGNRQQVRLRAAQMCLAFLRWKLLGVASPIQSLKDR
jgi:nicotinamide-nucleotide amidase